MATRTERYVGAAGLRAGTVGRSDGGLTLLPLAAALLLCACPSKNPTPPGADAGTRECTTRADCKAKGGDLEQMTCLPDFTCGQCSSDGQCELREKCDPTKRLCGFKTGWGDDCSANADCTAGQRCVQGLCVSEKDAVLCSAGRCLADGMRCNQANGVCEEDIGCLSDKDCSTGELCNVPTNACVLRCSEETQATVCGAGQKCLDSRCTDCADSSDCPGGMVCDRGRLTCVVDGSARCLSDRDCSAGLTCNRATGFCTPTPPPCLSNEDCFSDERCDIAAGKCVKRACQPDRYEPNAAMAEAAPIVSGDYANLTLCDGEQDWYSVKLTRGDRFDVFVDADPLFQDVMDTRLLDGTGRVLGQGALALDRTVSLDGTYYLRMQTSDAFVDYGLRIAISRGTPCDDDAFEPNDTAASAASLHDQGDYDKLTVCGLDRDWFLLDVPAGKKLRVELNYVPTEGAADLFVFAKDGTTQLGADQVTNPVQTVVVEAAAIVDGQVLIEVASLDERASAEYWLHVAYE
ncbi:MAG: hypothetical protein QM765_45920 [Myxococcales bacterium]